MSKFGLLREADPKSAVSNQMQVVIWAIRGRGGARPGKAGISSQICQQVPRAQSHRKNSGGHMFQSYPAGEVRELEYLSTTSYNPLVEDCFQRMLSP